MTRSLELANPPGIGRGRGEEAGVLMHTQKEGLEGPLDPQPGFHPPGALPGAMRG